MRKDLNPSKRRAAVLSHLFFYVVIPFSSASISYIEKGVFLTLTNADLPEKQKRKRPPRGESIEKRPAEVDARNTFGHWEMDTVYSKKKGSKALLVLKERLTRKEIIERMPDRTAESTVKALDRIERRYGARLALAREQEQLDLGERVGQVLSFQPLERNALVSLVERLLIHQDKTVEIYFRFSKPQ